MAGLCSSSDPSSYLTASYTLDAADNRTNVAVRIVMPQTVVLPLAGYTIIPLS